MWLERSAITDMRESDRLKRTFLMSFLFASQENTFTMRCDARTCALAWLPSAYSCHCELRSSLKPFRQPPATVDKSCDDFPRFGDHRLHAPLDAAPQLLQLGGNFRKQRAEVVLYGRNRLTCHFDELSVVRVALDQEYIRTRVCNAWSLHCGALARRNFK